MSLSTTTAAPRPAPTGTQQAQLAPPHGAAGNDGTGMHGTHSAGRAAANTSAHGAQGAQGRGQPRTEDSDGYGGLTGPKSKNNVGPAQGAVPPAPGSF